MHLLITGASGKLGSRVLTRLLQELPDATFTAMTHSRPVQATDRRLRVVQGDIADPDFVDGAMAGITHVIHMATCKEIPNLVMDVTVKGMFWLMESFRLRQGKYFILIGGDAAIGHSTYPASAPLTESAQHRAYPGCYALSKVLEEVLLTQFHLQYGIEGCCLRAPWIMADDDLRHALTFGEDVFGAPRWCDEVDREDARRYAAEQRVPLALAADGKPLKRGIIGVEDVVDAVVAALRRQPDGCETFNIAMDEPFDYRLAAEHLESRYGRPSVEVPTRLHSVWMDNSKARQQLAWRPRFDTRALVDKAWSYEGPRAPATIYRG
jgi:UDP-glucose 4-epimerase